MPLQNECMKRADPCWLLARSGFVNVLCKHVEPRKAPIIESTPLHMLSLQVEQVQILSPLHNEPATCTIVYHSSNNKNLTLVFLVNP